MRQLPYYSQEPIVCLDENPYQLLGNKRSPINASWLDQAEIETGIYISQCLGKRRIDNMEKLKKGTAAWNKGVNKQGLKFDWKFTTTKAQEKFKCCRFNLIHNMAG